LKTNFRRRRRLVGELIFEKMRVASGHMQTLPHEIPSTFGRVCPYSPPKYGGRVAYMETLTLITPNESNTSLM
jgi:hypothetical protein